MRPESTATAASAALGALMGLVLACAGPITGAVSEEITSSSGEGEWRAETRVVHWSGDLPWAMGERTGLAVVHSSGAWMRLDLPPGATVDAPPSWSDDHARFATSLGTIEIRVGEPSTP